MQLIILRHGRTQANEDHLYVGAHLDLPLSKNGRADARACGCVDGISLAFVSPMLRARETARICFPSARQIAVEGLREMDFGAFEGRSAESMENDAAYRAWVQGWCAGRCPGGENRDEFTHRVANAVERVLASARECELKRVVIVAHSGTVLATMNAFSRDAENKESKQGDSYFKWAVNNAEGYCAHVKFDTNGRPTLLKPRHFINLDSIQ